MSFSLENLLFSLKILTKTYEKVVFGLSLIDVERTRSRIVSHYTTQSPKRKSMRQKLIKSYKLFFYFLFHFSTHIHHHAYLHIYLRFHFHLEKKINFQLLIFFYYLARYFHSPKSVSGQQLLSFF